MKCKIDLEWEQIESIMETELADALKHTLSDIEAVKRNKQGFAYSFDMDEDIEELTIRAAALAVVLSYYGG